MLIPYLGCLKHQFTKLPVLPKKKSGLFASLGVLGDSNRAKSSSGFRIGDHVRVKYRGQEGTIIDINGSLIMVFLDDGKHVDSYDASQLEKAW